jgi:hypothetical protein
MITELSPLTTEEYQEYTALEKKEDKDSLDMIRFCYLAWRLTWFGMIHT